MALLQSFRARVAMNVGAHDMLYIMCVSFCAHACVFVSVSAPLLVMIRHLLLYWDKVTVTIMSQCCSQQLGISLIYN